MAARLASEVSLFADSSKSSTSRMMRGELKCLAALVDKVPAGRGFDSTITSGLSLINTHAPRMALESMLRISRIPESLFFPDGARIKGSDPMM